MRVHEIIQKGKNAKLLAENVHDPKIDWNKFKLAMAALATDTDSAGHGNIDGLVFLGLAGDPNSQSVLDVKLKSPARVGVADPDSSRDLGFRIDAKTVIAGQYFPNDYSMNQGMSDPGMKLRKEYRYNIIINYDHFYPATGEIDTSLLAHEARHRGFHILSQIPEIRNAVNPRTRKYVDDLYSYGETIPGLGLENTGQRDFLEHLMIYSLQVPNQIGPSHMFRSKQEVKMFQMMYRDFDSAAVSYIKRHPVPKGGLELLRKEVDRLTPDNVIIKILPDVNGKLIVTGFLDTLKQGAGWVADKVKSGLDMGTTPAKPASDKKPDQETWYDSLIDQIKKTAGLTPEIYIVKPDDTFKNIAQIKRVSVRALLKANPQIKDPEAIYAGDELIIP